MFSATIKLSRILPLITLIFIAPAAGCTNMVATEQPDTDPLTRLNTGIHPVAVVGSNSNGTTRVEIYLKRVGVNLAIASYQAELSFAKGSFVGADLPQGVAGSWNETTPGTVRFVGAALDGIGDSAVLIAHVRSSEQVRASDLRVTVEELTSTDGFEDATGLIVKTDHPILLQHALR